MGKKILAGLLFFTAASFIIGGIGVLFGGEGAVAGIIFMALGVGIIILGQRLIKSANANAQPVEIDPALQAFYDKIAPFGIKALRGSHVLKLFEAIDANEDFLYVLEAHIGISPAALAVTKSSVFITHQAGVRGANISAIPLQRITSVSTMGEKMGGLVKSLVIIEGAVTNTLENVPAPFADEAVIKINQAQAAASGPQVSTVTAPLSQADELAKYKKLLDDGVLSQEEFDKKKAQILGL